RRHRVVERHPRRGAAGGTDTEVGGAGGGNRDGAAGAGDRASIGVGGGDGLVARRLQRGTEGVHAVVLAAARRERVVRRQHRLAVRAGEVGGAGVAGGRVVEGVQRRHREVEGRAGGRRARGTDGEVGGGGGADRDGVAGAGDGTRGRV